MISVLEVLSTRVFRRFVTLFLLGFCLALWPLAGYAATLLVDSPTHSHIHQVNAPTQVGLEVEKSANTPQASVGDIISYTYRITNSGTVALTITEADDNRLGAVDGLEGALAPAATRSATLTYVVQLSDGGTSLVNSVTVTGTDDIGSSVTGNASVTVTIIDPTGLPDTEQPSQPSRVLFLPSIKP